MLAVQRLGRWLLVVVAMLATMHGLVHAHTSSVDAAAAQNCALCVSTESGLATAIVRVAPPAAIELVAAPALLVAAPRLVADSFSSRGPPLV